MGCKMPVKYEVLLLQFVCGLTLTEEEAQDRKVRMGRGVNVGFTLILVAKEHPKSQGNGEINKGTNCRCVMEFPIQDCLAFVINYLLDLLIIPNKAVLVFPVNEAMRPFTSTNCSRLRGV